MNAPEFHVLDHAACEALLHSHHVGRLAFSFRDRVDIEPVHFVYRDGWIYGRTQVGAKVTVLAHHPWVAFEVDAIHGLFDWESVVVHGRLEFPDPASGVPRDMERYATAVAAIRTLLPTAFGEGDPTPARTLVFALPASEMTGRTASTGDRSE